MRQGLILPGILRNLSNTGDPPHTLPNIYKLVPAMDKQAPDILSELYGDLSPTSANP